MQHGHAPPSSSHPSAPLPPSGKAWATGHAVQLYESEEFLAPTIGDFLLDGVRVGQPLVVVATAERRDRFVAHMRTRAVDVGELAPGRDIVMLDAEETLSRIMVGQAPDPQRFDAVIGGVLRTLTSERPYVVARVYGEMVDILWKQGKPAAAIALEELWNELGTRFSFDLVCAYDMSSFACEGAGEAFGAMCAQHGRVRPTESYLHGDEEHRLRQIAVLQQRAASLEDALRQKSRLEEELRRREIELRDFLENGLEPMHWVDANGIITWANRAELDLLGYTRAEYVGRHIADFHCDPGVISNILSRLSHGEDLRNVRARLRCKDGSERVVLINSNVYWQDGKFVHTRCFSRDVTQLS